MRLHYVLRKHVSHVELRKARKSCVGIVAKGVKKRGRPSVKSIQLNSAAHRSQCVCVGDVIISVCGRDASGMGKRDFKRLSHSTEVVQLELEYEIREPRLNTSGVYQLRRMPVRIKKTSNSFGFVLRKVGKKYSVASEYPILSIIAQHEPVSKDFSLRSGDRLIQIDDQDLSWLSLEKISEILAQKEEAVFLIEYSVGIVEPCVRPGGRIELEMECLDSDIGIVLAFSKDKSLHIKEIQKGSMAERCGVFQVGDAVLYINDISTSHLSISDANALLKSFKKVPGRLTFVHNAQEDPIRDTNTNLLDSNTFTKKDLHPVLSAVPSERLHLIPPQNSPESLYNWHFKRTHSKLPKTDRKSFDFQSKTVSMLNDVVRKVSTLQELINFRKHRPNLKELNCSQNVSNFINEYHTSQKVPCHINEEIDDQFDNFERNYFSDSESKDFVKMDTNRLSQLEALCIQTKDSARTIAMHFVKNSINVSLVNDSSVDLLSGDTSYFLRSKIIHELTENLAEIHSKKLMSIHILDNFLQKVSAVDFDCRECSQLCLSAALTVQKIMLLLTLNDPDLDAMFVINTLLLSAVNVDVPCEDCSTPWCSVSEVGKESSKVKEDKHSCDLLCHSKDVEADLLNLDSTSETDLLGSQNSRNLLIPPDLSSSHDLPKGLEMSLQGFKKLGKRPEVNLNVEDKSAYYNLAHVDSSQSSIASESDTVSSLRPKKMIINTRNISCNSNSFNTSQRSHAFTEQLKVPNNSPNDFKVTKNKQITTRPTIVEGNYSQNCKEKIQVDKHMPTKPKKLWKSAEAITRISENGLFRKFKSVITKHSSDPTGFSKSPVDLFEKDNTSCRPTSTALGGNDCEWSQITSIVTTDSNPLTDILGRMKSCSSSMEVNLKNEGQGFGLEIEYLSYPRDGVTLTIIANVEPNTAAANSGILLKGDRIVKINGEATIGLTLDEFSNLTKEAFSEDEVTLSVNFDVALPEVRFGTFDVHFDKILKPGIEFKDFSKGGPLIVRGVAKGSAAHRSGQLFAGDEILFTNCIRQEAFDSRKCAYTRTDMVIMTVRREHTEPDSNPEPEENTPPPHSTSSTPDACAVHRTSLHTISGSGALVLEQVLTLSRDPRLGDFGFLVGKNLGTGGVHVAGIRPGGPADRSGVVKKNDTIVKIDGTLVGNGSSSLSLLMQAGESLELTTRRMLTRKKD
ncbi:hypothetical protein JTE90_010901 [Oedothorax gibbosus]|uniref:PDZ domain-containing protein n=1 Tax=Oedothorax gibbosus TaxID=931172 RepID=A0AAV6UH29_9ARAC|nr:hypothetical protein JTE90_010901 [Oedothorax gibbosus]